MWFSKSEVRHLQILQNIENLEKMITNSLKNGR